MDRLVMGNLQRLPITVLTGVPNAILLPAFAAILVVSAWKVRDHK
jgi:hypothetical protein